jgi:hypothetical protein
MFVILLFVLFCRYTKREYSCVLHGVFKAMTTPYDMLVRGGVDRVIEDHFDRDEVEFKTIDEIGESDGYMGLTKVLAEIVYFEKPPQSLKVNLRNGTKYSTATKEVNYAYMLVLRDCKTGSGFVLFIKPDQVSTLLAVQKTVWLGCTVAIFDAVCTGFYTSLPAFTTKHLVLPLSSVRGSVLRVGTEEIAFSPKTEFTTKHTISGFQVFHGSEITDLEMTGVFFEESCKKWGCDGNHEGTKCSSPTNLGCYGKLVISGFIQIPSLQVGKGSFRIRSTARLFVSDEIFQSGAMPDVPMYRVNELVTKSIEYYVKDGLFFYVAGWYNAHVDPNSVDGTDVKQHVTVVRLNKRYRSRDNNVDFDATIEDSINNNPFRIRMTDGSSGSTRSSRMNASSVSSSLTGRVPRIFERQRHDSPDSPHHHHKRKKHRRSRSRSVHRRRTRTPPPPPPPPPGGTAGGTGTSGGSGYGRGGGASSSGGHANNPGTSSGHHGTSSGGGGGSGTQRTQHGSAKTAKKFQTSGGTAGEMGSSGTAGGSGYGRGGASSSAGGYGNNPGTSSRHHGGDGGGGGGSGTQRTQPGSSKTVTKSQLSSNQPDLKTQSSSSTSSSNMEAEFESSNTQYEQFERDEENIFTASDSCQNAEELLVESTGESSMTPRFNNKLTTKSSSLAADGGYFGNSFSSIKSTVVTAGISSGYGSFNNKCIYGNPNLSTEEIIARAVKAGFQYKPAATEMYRVESSSSSIQRFFTASNISDVGSRLHLDPELMRNTSFSSGPCNSSTEFRRFIHCETSNGIRDTIDNLRKQMIGVY